MAVNVIIVFILLVILLFFAQIILREVYRLASSKTWQVTDGQITELNTGTWTKGNVTFTNHRLKCRYKYVVNGTSYTGDSIEFGAFQNFTGVGDYFIRKYAPQYRTGARISVYYDPANPQKSVLNRTLSLPFFILALATFAMLSFVVIRIATNNYQ